MPGLRRLHFASVGHRDARLAPLTLDLRDERGHPTDSVLWLRNGGGKSSLLNLLFAVLRPGRRDFLGTSAEGRSRRLEDYVRSTDLAFVVSEWTLPTSRLRGAASSEAPGEGGTRVVGQLMAWRGQQRSSDRSRLRRVFFSLRSDDGLRWEDLPIAGLGQPASSPEEFVAWLREQGRQRPARELVIEEGLTRWTRHLEAIGLDPELYAYQVRMNQREGAADELFRFSSAARFVEFLLELAFDPGQANEVSATLKELREQIRELPRRQLERSFAAAVHGRLGPLVAASEQLARVEAALDAQRRTAGALMAWLQASQREHQAAAERAQAVADSARQRRRQADNELRTLDRWAHGLERLAARLGLAECDAALEVAVRDERALALRARLLAACPAFRRCEGLREQRAVLEQELSRRTERQAPLLDRTRRAGSALAALLDVASRAQRARVDRDTEERRALHEQRWQLQRQQAGHQQKLGAARQQERQLAARLVERDSERQRLLERGDLEVREEVQAAVARWNRVCAESAADLERLDRQQQELRARREELTAERARSEATRGARAPELERALVELRDAEQRRQRLRDDPLLRELEEVDAVAVDAEGLSGRILRAADEAERELLDAELEGAQDRRCVESLSSSGLLPPSTDVDRTVRRLTAAGLQAWSAYAYLAENLRGDPAAKRTLLQRDPARFSGVFVPDVDAAQRALALPDIAGDLRSPVTLSVCSLHAQPPGPSQQRWVLGPTDSGAFDTEAASAAGLRIEARVRARRARAAELEERRRSLRDRASELAGYLERYGGPRFERLVERIDALQAEIRRLDERQRQLDGELSAAAEQQEALATRRAGRQAQLDDARLRNGRLATFLHLTEQHVAAWRSQIDAARSARKQLESELGALAAEVAARDERAEHLSETIAAGVAAFEGLAAERAAIEYLSDDPEAAQPPETLTLPVARQRWASVSRLLRQELGAEQVAWECEQLSQRLGEAESELRRLQGELTAESVAALSGEVGEQWEAASAATEQALQGAREQVGRARELLRQAGERVEELGRRREADDLPAGEAPPTTAAAARSRAEVLRQRKDRVVVARGQADETLRRSEREGAEAHHKAEQRQAQGRRLGDAVQLTPAPPAALSEGPEVEERLGEIIAAARRDRDALASARELLRTCAEDVRQVALAPAFAEHRSVIKERLLDPEDTLVASAQRYEAQLGERIAALDAEIEQLDSHRRTLVSALLHVAQSAELLLGDAARASRLPDSLGRWAGSSFLEITPDLPGSDDERRARLGPLVDRLALEGSVPDGLRLAQLAIEELSGPRGVRVTLLKPEALRRVERVPVAAMVNFSGGERLTTAVLLYCSLVRLRARRRGRRATDGGVLVLDNPIGTCSSVALLELQREVAAAMGVQLLYTTGVDDLSALAQLPNVVRLRNTHRDRLSGDLHVTTEHEAQLQAVRVVRRTTSAPGESP